MTYFSDLVEELRRGDSNGCKHANLLMNRAADALVAVQGDSYEGQVQHARWQERAETLEGAIRAALDYPAILPPIASEPRRILSEALRGE